MIELIGKNGSGKTFIANELGKRGYNKIVGYTTRPMRVNEVDKVDYNFVMEDEFKNMIYCGQFIDYKVRNGNYYGISKNLITSSSIITSGNSDLIAKQTGYPVYKIYLDANLITRYRRMIERNPEDNLFERIHSENFSFLNNFKALFIDNNINNPFIVDKIEKVIKDGIISEDMLINNKSFILAQVNKYELSNHKNSDIILELLEYEEYILRSLSLESNIDKRKIYYKLIKDYLETLKIEYEEEKEKFLVYNNKKKYTINYKRR